MGCKECTYVLVPIVLGTGTASCVTLGKSPDLSEPWVSPLQSGSATQTVSPLSPLQGE